MDKNQDKKRKKRFYDNWFLEERAEFIEEETQEEIEKGEGEKEEVEKLQEKAKDNKLLQSEATQKEKKHYQEKGQKILEKIKILFETKEGEAEFLSEEKEDKPEDYKTYLEKQKQIQAKEKEEELEENSLPAKKILKLEKIKENDKITLIKEQIKSLIAKVKKILKKLKEKIKKVTNKTTANITELYEEKENLSATSKLKELESEEEEKASANSDLQKSHDSKKTKEDSLKQTLKNLGIKADNLKDFDIFKKKEKKTKPSLASVKVKRIKQENKLEKLEEDVALEQEKVKIETPVKTKEEKQETKQQEERKQLKNKEKIEKLNQEFNKINRKQDKITLNKEEENDKIEKAFKEIKQTQEEVGKDHKDYTIKVENLDTEKNRRKKISKTTVEDVLKGSENLFETDIDRVAKKLVLNRNSDIKEEEKPVSSEVEEFRKEVYKEKTSKNLVDNERKTNLDKLILDAKIVENKNKTLSKEVEELNENLKIIKEENEFKKELDREFEEEMSLEKMAKETSPAKDSKAESNSKPDEREKSLKGYSDYHLDEKEIQELMLKNKIESGAEKADIETLNKDMSIKKEEKDDIEKFKEEKMLPKKASKTVINVISTKRGSSKKEEKEEDKIEYKEKLYENEPNKFFDDGKEFTFGEYKTKDRGYRPVSREKMIQDKKKLDEIFQKYSNINIPVARNKEIEQKIKSPTRHVTKYKPTRLVSSVYGTCIPKNQGKNYFKEIASQDEVTWKIDVGSKAIKNKKKIKKSRKK